MNFKIIITQRAENDIDIAADYIFKKSCSKEVTVKFINGIYDAIEVLSKFPLSGQNPRSKALFKQGYKYVVYGEYLIFYKIDKKNIIVGSVIHSKRDYYRFYNF